MKNKHIETIFHIVLHTAVHTVALDLKSNMYGVILICYTQNYNKKDFFLRKKYLTAVFFLDKLLVCCIMEKSSGRWSYILLHPPL